MILTTSPTRARRWALLQAVARHRRHLGHPVALGPALTRQAASDRRHAIRLAVDPGDRTAMIEADGWHRNADHVAERAARLPRTGR